MRENLDRIWMEPNPRDRVASDECWAVKRQIGRAPPVKLGWALRFGTTWHTQACGFFVDKAPHPTREACGQAFLRLDLETLR